MHDLTESVRDYAVNTLDFDLCRFTSPFVGDFLSEYRDLVATEQFGDMGYLNRHLPFKEDPELLLPGVQSAVVVAKNYKNTSLVKMDGDRKVSRYAAGEDYHQVILERLELLSSYLKGQVPESLSYVGVDSRPLAERSLALQAGIGFRGKNTMVIRPKLGSYFFIGVMLSTVPLVPDNPFIGGCGTCQRCIDACPTGAISLDGKLTPTKCISYATIERKSVPTTEERTLFKGWVFGCDICQEVCPFNHEGIPLSNWGEWAPSRGVGFSLAPERIPDDIPKNTVLYRSRKRLS